MDTDRKIEFLKKMELFSSLGPEDLLQVGGKVVVRQFKKNDTILFKGDTNSNNAPQRVKTLLMMLAKRYGRNAREETVLNIRLTHQSIANMTGLTRETVTRVIDVWQKNGDISTKNKLIKLNPAFMQQI